MGANLHVRTCEPLLLMSETAGRILLKFGMCLLNMDQLAMQATHGSSGCSAHVYMGASFFCISGSTGRIVQTFAVLIDPLTRYAF